MTNKCGIEKCTGNYNKKNKCRVFRLPKDRYERQKWLDVLPRRENYVINCDRFYICEKHWEAEFPSIRLPGGATRPAIPPSIFNVPASCLPPPKPVPPPVEAEDKQLPHVFEKEKKTPFDVFRPERELQKQYKNLIISRSEERLVCLFMTEDMSECILSVIVENKPTLRCPLVCRAFKKGVSVPLGKTLNPNNSLKSYGQLAEIVRLASDYEIPFNKTIEIVVPLLKTHMSGCMNAKNEKRLVFLTHQLELLSKRQFSTNDYSFALKSYPKCRYEQLRGFLVLPCRRMLYLNSSTDKDQFGHSEDVSLVEAGSSYQEERKGMRNRKKRKTREEVSEIESDNDEEDEYYDIIAHDTSSNSSSTRPAGRLDSDDDDDDDDDDGSDEASKSRKFSTLLTPEQEEDLVDWFRGHPLFYDKIDSEFKKKLRKNQLLEGKGNEMGISGVVIWSWFKHMRRTYGKLKKRRSDMTGSLTSREMWTLSCFKFLEPHLSAQEETPQVYIDVTNDGEEKLDEEGSEYGLVSLDSSSSYDGFPSGPTTSQQGRSSAMEDKEGKTKTMGMEGRTSHKDWEKVNTMEDKDNLTTTHRTDVGITPFPDSRSTGKGVQDDRMAFCHWLGLESSKLSEELWNGFMAEAFGLVIKYRQLSTSTPPVTFRTRTENDW